MRLYYDMCRFSLLNMEDFDITLHHGGYHTNMSSKTEYVGGKGIRVITS